MATASLNPLINEITERLSIEEKETALDRFKSTFGEKYRTSTNIVDILNAQAKDNRINPANVAILQDCLVIDSSPTKDEILRLLNNFTESHQKEIELLKQQESLLIKRKEIHDLADSVLRNGHGLLLFGDHGVGKTWLAKDFLNDRYQGKVKEVDLREIRDIKVAAVEILRQFGYLIRWQLINLEVFASKLRGITQTTMLFMDNADDILNDQSSEFGFFDLVDKIVSAGKGHIKMLITSRIKSNDPRFNNLIRQQKIDHLESKLAMQLLESFKMQEKLSEEKLFKATELCQNLPINITLLGGILQDSDASFESILQLVQQIAAAAKLPLPATGIAAEAKTTIYTDHFLSTSFGKLSDTLQIGAVAASLFCRPFSFESLASILDTIETCKLHLILNTLKHARLIHVIEKTTARKEIMFDMHPLVRKFFQSKTSEGHLSSFHEDARTKFLRKFRLHLQNIAEMLQSDYQEAHLLFSQDYSNFEFVFSQHIELGTPLFGNYHDLQVASALIQVMFEKKWKISFFQKLAESSFRSGNKLLGALFLCHSAYCKSSIDPHTANDVLQEAKMVLDKVDNDTKEASYVGTFRLNEIKAVKSAYYQTKGLVYFDICKLSRALKDNKEALEASRKSRLLREDLYQEKSHSDLANTYLDLGAIHNLRSELLNGKERLHHLDLARIFFTKALKMFSSINKSGKHVRMPTLLQNIGTVYYAEEQYRKAEKYYKQALSMEKELKVEGFYTTATVMMNLANTYRDLKKHTKALKMAQESSMIRIQLLGDHADTVHSLYVEAVVHHELRNYVDAIRIYQKAFEMDEKLPPKQRSIVNEDIRSAMTRAYEKAIANRLTYLVDEFQFWKSKFEKMDKEEKQRTHKSKISHESNMPSADFNPKLAQFVDVGTAKMLMTSDGGLFSFEYLDVSLSLPIDALMEPTELELSRIDLSKINMELSFGESILGDAIILGPESVTFLKPATLRIPYNIFEVPIMAMVVGRHYSLSEHRWISLPTVTRQQEDGGGHWVEIEVVVAGIYTVCLLLEKVEFVVPQDGKTVYADGIKIEFQSETFGKGDKKGSFKANVFPETAVNILERLGIATSSILHINMDDDVVPNKPVKIELNIKNKNKVDGKLMILRGDGAEFTEVTDTSNHEIFVDWVTFEVTHFSMFAVVWTRVVDVVSILQTYLYPAFEAEFHLYAKQYKVESERILSCCIACCSVNDVKNAEAWFYEGEFTKVEKARSQIGVYMGATMKVIVEGEWKSHSVNPLRLCVHSLKFSTTETFVMKKEDRKHSSLNHFNLVCEKSNSSYACFSYLGLIQWMESEAEVEEETDEEESEDEDDRQPPFRFLGLKMHNCRLDDVLMDYTEYSGLESLGLSEQKIQDFKAQWDKIGHQSKLKMVFEEVTVIFRRGKLKSGWFENYFAKLRNYETRQRISKVYEFLIKPVQELKNEHCDPINDLLPLIYKADLIDKVWKKLGVYLKKDMGYLETLGRKRSPHDDLTDDAFRCKSLLEDFLTQSANEELNFLVILKALLKSLHVFREDQGKRKCVQTILDNLGSKIQELLDIKDD